VHEQYFAKNAKTMHLYEKLESHLPLLHPRAAARRALGNPVWRESGRLIWINTATPGRSYDVVEVRVPWINE
jgi:hypothetical protein